MPVRTWPDGPALHTAGWRRLLLVGTLALSTACATRRVELPDDLGTPLPDPVAWHAAASDACRGVRTMTAEVSLSGRAGDEGLRGTIHAGFRRPSSMLLQFQAGPFGTVGFVLGADETGATLLLPRSDQVVRGAAEDIMAALTGLAFTPADLQAILTGCVVAEPRAVAGRTHRNGWTSIELEGGATLYFEPAGDRWRVRAARRQDWRIEYPEWADRAAFPARVRVLTETPVAVDLRARIAQVTTNVELEDGTFRVKVPADAEVITVDDVRRAGPLRGEEP